MIHTQGKLSNGVKWLFDGDEVYTYSPDRDEWAVPCWASLTESERDELSAIGAEMNALKAEAEAEGLGWAEAVEQDGDREKWGYMDFPEFYHPRSRFHRHRRRRRAHRGPRWHHL